MMENKPTVTTVRLRPDLQKRFRQLRVDMPALTLTKLLNDGIEHQIIRYEGMIARIKASKQPPYGGERME